MLFFYSQEVDITETLENTELNSSSASEENIKKANELILEQSKIFGKIQHLVADDLITDINCNSHSIWVDHIKKGRYRYNRYNNE